MNNLHNGNILKYLEFITLKEIGNNFYTALTNKFKNEIYKLIWNY